MDNLQDQGLKEDQKNKVNKNLDKLWDAVQHEFYYNRKKVIGKLLTIIDAVIIDKDQNKSVKNLINSAVWEDSDRLEKSMINWFVWFIENSKITDSDQESNVPMKYDGPPMPSLANFIN